MLQMTCPFCKQEFPYDNGRLDREISMKGQRIHEITRRLSEIKYMDKRLWSKATWKERKRLTLELSQLKVEIAELKAVRKACDQQINSFSYQMFKEIVKERYGETEYRAILDQVEEELKAYKISGLMRHEYTRAPGRSNVTSVNKLR